MENRDIDGCVVILASNVTLRRCRVRCGSEAAAVLVNWGYSGLSGILIEDCEIDGKGEGQFGVSGSGMTVRRCDISNGTDGIMFSSSDVVIEDNFVHDLASPPGAHNDGLQTEGVRDVVIRHNNIEVAYPQTGCISLWGSTNNILVENNLLNGGGWTTYAGDQGTNIRFINNHFGRKFYPNCGYWGPVTSWNAGGNGNQWTGNVWDDTGLPVNP